MTFFSPPSVPFSEGRRMCAPIRESFSLVPEPRSNWISLSCSLPHFLSFKMVLSQSNQLHFARISWGLSIACETKLNLLSMVSWICSVLRCPTSLLGKIFCIPCGPPDRAFSLCPPPTCLQEQTGNLDGLNIALQAQGDRPRWDLSQANHSYKIQYMNSEMPGYKDSGALGYMVVDLWEVLLLDQKMSTQAWLPAAILSVTWSVPFDIKVQPQMKTP